MSDALRVGFCVSGRGCLFQAAVHHRDALGILPSLLILDGTASEELEGFAAAHEIRCLRLATKSRSQRDRILHETCTSADLDLLSLTFNKLLAPDLVSHYQGRIINVHPSLLPAFKGLGAIEAAIASGARVTGATIHVVTDELDSGPVVAQTVVGVDPNDTAAELGARIYRQLQPMYLQVIRWYAEDRVALGPNEKVLVKNGYYGATPTAPAVERDFTHAAIATSRKAA